MDPAQDPLVVVEQSQDDSPNPHPAGPMEGTLTPKCDRYRYSYSTQMSANYPCIFMACEESKELRVWDWKIGPLCLHITGLQITSWAFLSSRFLLISRTDSKYNEEYETTVYIPHLAVIDLETAPSPNRITVSGTNYVCAFHYPPVIDNVLVLDMFAISHDKDVVLRPLVRGSTFLRALAGLAPGETRRDFAWDEWGPRGSRLMWTPTPVTCHVYGTMLATTEADSRPDTPGYSRVWMSVTLRDFEAIHPAAERGVGGKDSRLGDEKQAVRVVAHATMLEPVGVFNETVTSSLPYVERVLVLPQERQDEWDAVIPREDALALVGSVWRRHMLHWSFTLRLEYNIGLFASEGRGTTSLWLRPN
ncbi:hypothetical protein V8D89_007494 [Ganoderma adspersum]